MFFEFIKAAVTVALILIFLDLDQLMVVKYVNIFKFLRSMKCQSSNNVTVGKLHTAFF